MLSNTGALSPAFASTMVQIDYSADLVEESKAKIIKELETIPLIINEHNLLEGAAPFAIASAGPCTLTFPSMLFLCFKNDDPEKMRSTFFERLRLHLESITPDKVVCVH